MERRRITSSCRWRSGMPMMVSSMQSMLGSGVFEANKAVDVAGTCAMFCVSTAGIVPELSQKGSGLIFNSGTLENTYFYWGFVRTGGLALRWFKDNVCQQAADAGYYKQLSEKAAAVAPGANDVVFLPYLTGGYEEGSDVRGAFLNMTLDTDQFVLWRAVLEAIAYDYMAITDTYRAAGIGINRITITEGGSRDDLWNQIKADVMQAEAITLEVSGGAVLTNCVIAAYATGAAADLKQVLTDNMKVIRQYQPDPDKADFYRQQSKKQQLLLKKLSC